MFFPGLSRTECASWVQAWGSIFAICAAIGIAWWQRSEERRHIREMNLASGLVVADSILYSMINASAVLAATADFLESCKRGEREFVARHHFDVLRRVTMPTNDELLGIAPCWPEAAQFIAEARSALKSAINMLEHLAAVQVLNDGPKNSEVLDHVIRCSSDGYQLLVEAHRAIRPEEIAIPRPANFRSKAMKQEKLRR